jgi:hypothetical protein
MNQLKTINENLKFLVLPENSTHVSNVNKLNFLELLNSYFSKHLFRIIRAIKIMFIKQITITGTMIVPIT